MKEFYQRLRSILAHIWHTRSNDAFISYLKKCGVNVGNNVNFRYPLHTTIDISRPSLVEIGDNVDINENFTIMTHDFGTYVFRNVYGDFVPSSGKVKIGNNIYFGRDVTLLKGVTIGDNCIIGIGSIVTKDIPSYSVACGSPCKVICSLEDYYKKRKSASIKEAIAYGKTLLDKNPKYPSITEFTEEWSLFLTEEDLKIYPEMHKIVDWRLKEDFHSFRRKYKPFFNGYREFIKYIINNDNAL